MRLRTLRFRVDLDTKGKTAANVTMAGHAHFAGIASSPDPVIC